MSATMTRTKRTDEHRPSVIEPSEYTYVAVEHEKSMGLESIPFILEQRRRIASHMAKTGGTYSHHEHGGNCHICGAHAIYTVLFHHAKSNTYIRTGFDCAEKLDMGNARDFRSLKAAVKDAREAAKGKGKAKAILSDAGLNAAWAVYSTDMTGVDVWPFEERVIAEIVGKLVKYGSVSDKQLAFVRDLLGKIERRPQLAAKRAAEKEAAADCVEGRQTIFVTVIKTEYRDSAFGESLKMLAKADDGFLVWGTVPSSLQLIEATDYTARDESFEQWQARLSLATSDAATIERLKGHFADEQRDGVTTQRGLTRGDRIELTATFERSQKDSKFGFYKRPYAKLVS